MILILILIIKIFKLMKTLNKDNNDWIHKNLINHNKIKTVSKLIKIIMILPPNKIAT